jgi:plasmid stability protein
MANLTLVVDEALIKAARMRAISEGTSVSALVRDFLQAYASANVTSTVLVAGEPTPAPLHSGRAGGARPAPPPLSSAEAKLPPWLTQVRERVQAFGGAEPADWLPPRDPSRTRSVL